MAVSRSQFASQRGAVAEIVLQVDNDEGVLGGDMHTGHGNSILIAEGGKHRKAEAEFCPDSWSINQNSNGSDASGIHEVDSP
jgi:hypothetical protein